MKILRRAGICFNNDMYHKLFSFLSEPCNSIYLQSYLIMCSGHMKAKEIAPRLKEILDEIEFIDRGHYTFRKLFTIDQEWCEFFKENAYPHPSGQRHVDERRRGVDKLYVDEIMELKYGNPPRSMDEAICEACLRKLDQFG